MPQTIRPVQLSSPLQRKIIAFVRRGLPLECATLASGVSRRTARRWRLKGERARSGRYHELFAAAEEARAKAEADALRIIAAARRKQWQAAAWWLERAAPERWGRREKHEISGPDGAPLYMEARLRAMSDEELMEFVCKAQAIGESQAPIAQRGAQNDER